MTNAEHFDRVEYALILSDRDTVDHNAARESLIALRVAFSTSQAALIAATESEFDEAEASGYAEYLRVTGQEGPQVKKETTTDLEELRNGNKPFTWGQVNEIHEIGPYSIVEYYPTKSDGHRSRLNFALYIGGEPTSSSWHSLDAALAAGIAYRAEGCNHRGDLYFIAAMESFGKGQEKKC